MKNSIHKYLIFTAVLLMTMAGSLQATQVTFRAHVDRAVTTMNTPIIYTLEISADVRSIPDPVLPNLKDFDIRREVINRSTSSMVRSRPRSFAIMPCIQNPQVVSLFFRQALKSKVLRTKRNR